MAGFNIANFRSKGLPLGGARPSLFQVTMSFPNVPGVTVGTEERFAFTCRSAEIPPSSIRPVEVPYFGRKIRIAGDRDYPDWNVTVMNDEDFKVRNALEAWHNAVNSIVSNRLDERVAGINPNLNNSYKTTAIVTQFAKTGPGDIDGDGAIKTYKFEGIFPVMISPIKLDWDATNQFEEFQVEFTYDWWEPYTKANDQPIFPIELNPA